MTECDGSSQRGFVGSGGGGAGEAPPKEPVSCHHAQDGVSLGFLSISNHIFKSVFSLDLIFP